MRNFVGTAIVIIVLIFVGGWAAAGDVRSSGSWARQEFRISGSWSIVEEDGRLQVRLSDEFKTKSAPDLKLFLSRGDLHSLSGKNATNGALLIAPLSSNKGAQSYALPDGIDLSGYKSIIIHCQKYSKLWGGSPL